jgi:ATP-binding cassette subfamily F protein 3
VAAPLAGRRIPAADLAVGYFAQQQMEQLNPDCDAFWHLRHRGGVDYASGDEQRVRDHLGRFGFEGDRAFEAVTRFSGGEKARLTLALIVARRPNLLLLDEPTNHLDIDMRHALNVALQSFEGGLVVVSHDRHLIKTVADTLWLVADGAVGAFDGDLDDYQRWLKDRAQDQSRARTAKKTTTARAPRKATVRIAPLRRELAEIEQKIAALTAERTAIEAALSAGSTSATLIDRFGQMSREVSSLEARWMDVGSAIEAAELDVAGSQ